MCASAPRSQLWELPMPPERVQPVPAIIHAPARRQRARRLFGFPVLATHTFRVIDHAVEQPVGHELVAEIQAVGAGIVISQKMIARADEEDIGKDHRGRRAGRAVIYRPARRSDDPFGKGGDAWLDEVAHIGGENIIIHKAFAKSEDMAAHEARIPADPLGKRLVVAQGFAN